MRQEVLQKEEVVCRFGVKDKNYNKTLCARPDLIRAAFLFALITFIKKLWHNKC